MLGIRQRLDGLVRADVLIEAAVRAVSQGVDSPSLSLLAGLTRTEEPDAQELLRAVLPELSLTLPAPPADRWELVRWWCLEIVAGRTRPEVGGQVIWEEGFDELGYPDRLQPIVGWVSEWDDCRPEWRSQREEYARKIVDEAQALLARPWPPA